MRLKFQCKTVLMQLEYTKYEVDYTQFLVLLKNHLDQLHRQTVLTAIQHHIDIRTNTPPDFISSSPFYPAILFYLHIHCR